MPDPSLLPSVEQRLEKIESLLAHLQHDIDSLNTALLNHFRQLKEFESRFLRLEQQFETLQEVPERRDPARDRPPHY